MRKWKNALLSFTLAAGMMNSSISTVHGNEAPVQETGSDEESGSDLMEVVRTKQGSIIEESIDEAVESESARLNKEDGRYTNSVNYTPSLIIHNEDTLRKLTPGDSGTLSVSIKPVLDCEMDGDIAIFSEDESVFTIDENFNWKALKPGVAIIWFSITYSQESLDRLYSMYPDTEFYDLLLGTGRLLIISAPTYRLYNPNSGEHFFTTNQDESSMLAKIGWKLEGISWQSFPETDEYSYRYRRPVYRLYNPNAGDHHYTVDWAERCYMIEHGWKDEGVAFYDDPDQGQPIYRLYNPNAKTAIHHFTTDEHERDVLASLGWKDEGIAWYAKR